MSRSARRPEAIRPERKNKIDWFQSADESVETIADWDIKAEIFASAILEVLSAGDGVMFGVSLAGDAISVTIYSGDVKRRKWITDAVELDELMALLYRQGRLRRQALGDAHIDTVG